MMLNFLAQTLGQRKAAPPQADGSGQQQQPIDQFMTVCELPPRPRFVAPALCWLFCLVKPFF